MLALLALPYALPIHFLWFSLVLLASPYAHRMHFQWFSLVLLAPLHALPMHFPWFFNGFPWLSPMLPPFIFNWFCMVLIRKSMKKKMRKSMNEWFSLILLALQQASPHAGAYALQAFMVCCCLHKHVSEMASCPFDFAIRVLITNLTNLDLSGPSVHHPLLPAPWPL